MHTQNEPLPQILVRLYDDDSNKEVTTVRELALKFTQPPFEYREDEERFYYLETILSDKMNEIGDMAKLYNYIKRKLSSFERMTKADCDKYLQELRLKYRKDKGKLFRELINAKGEDDTCHFYNLILGFNLMGCNVTKKHKFAFIRDRLTEDKPINLHKQLTLNWLIPS